MPSSSPRNRRGAGLFPAFLGFIVLLFVSLLVYTYVEAKKANPVMLDERGQPRPTR